MLEFEARQGSMNKRVETESHRIFGQMNMALQHSEHTCN